ncbi:THUMP domain-containing protein 2 isoform X2 [Acanthochromis polyacanthus]|uniref:THUMP domain-containing protein 2 isoform X2 n=1 Tax=Acanthochromis polyacanthus TaxID=80966 RepID=UPI0022344BE2|nr:THUMP domain-containing protein 2 isoform X2 [Acanthochromis polyacanthus]
MAEPRSEEDLIRYFCTAGNGMEPFLMEEVKKKLAAEDVCQLPGKVLFSSSAGIDKISDLKAAERLFLLLKQDSPLRISAHTSSAKAASVLQYRLLGDKNQWTGAVMTWSRLQGELAGSRTTARTPSSALGLMIKIEEGRGSRGKEEEEGSCLVESRKSPEEQREEENGNERLKSGEQNGTRTLEKKRKRNHEEEEEEAERKNVEKGKSAERGRRREEEAETGMDVEFNSYHGTDVNQSTTDLENNVESSSRTMDFTERLQNVNTCGDKDQTPLIVGKSKPELSSSIPVSFRISCKCTGSLSRCFSAQEVSSVMGAGLSRLLGWKVDLKNPQLEINVYLGDDLCLLGIPLTRSPLAKRSYIKTTGLRSTVAWAMTCLAHIQPGSRVIDPMCGAGTILIEAAQEHEAACFLGLDIDDGQLQKASENTAFAELGHRIHLLKASSLALPLTSSSVDAVICDLPFGRKFGTKTDMAANLPLILAEMERSVLLIKIVLCVGGTLVLLLSPQLSFLLKKVLTGPSSHQEAKPPPGTENSPSPSVCATKQQAKASPQLSLLPRLSSLRHEATFRVSLGAIDGLIHKYVKTEC